MKKTYKVLMTLLLAGTAILGIAALAHQRSLSEDTYYLPAEVVSSQAGVTIFGQVDGEQPTNYVYSVSGTYPDGVPYLLTMDTLGTETPADDEILVVWLPAAEAPAAPSHLNEPHGSASPNYAKHTPANSLPAPECVFCCTQTAPVSCWGPSLPR